MSDAVATCDDPHLSAILLLGSVESKDTLKDTIEVYIPPLFVIQNAVGHSYGLLPQELLMGFTHFCQLVSAMRRTLAIARTRDEVDHRRNET